MSVSLLCRAEISTSSALYPNGCFQLMGSIDPALAASANCSATGNKSIQDPWARQGGPGAEGSLQLVRRQRLDRRGPGEKERRHRHQPAPARDAVDERGRKGGGCYQ